MWAPDAGEKWYVITSLDDHSRRILYADLFERESSWAHIVAAKYVAATFGIALAYYVDNHVIFRYLEKRDNRHCKYTATEETAQVQWKEVLRQLGIDVHYAMSPAAKGKIERPYRWLQDHLVRTCLREGVTRFEDARKLLHEEVHHYNHKRIHSVTKEIPVLRFERALDEKRSLFKPLNIHAPYQSLDDIFCYRFKRMVDPYRKISFNNLKFAISGAPIHANVELRVSFNLETKIALIRIWYQLNLIGEHRVKLDELNLNA